MDPATDMLFAVNVVRGHEVSDEIESSKFKSYNVRRIIPDTGMTVTAILRIAMLTADE